MRTLPFLMGVHCFVPCNCIVSVCVQDLINLAGTLVQAILNGILVWQSVSSAKQMQDEVPQSF